MQRKEGFVHIPSLIVGDTRLLYVFIARKKLIKPGNTFRSGAEKVSWEAAGRWDPGVEATAAVLQVDACVICIGTASRFISPHQPRRQNCWGGRARKLTVVSLGVMGILKANLGRASCTTTFHLPLAVPTADLWTLLIELLLVYFYSLSIL